MPSRLGCKLKPVHSKLFYIKCFLLYIRYECFKGETLQKSQVCSVVLFGELLIWIKTIEAPYGRMMFPLGHLQSTSDSFSVKDNQQSAKIGEGASLWERSKSNFIWLNFALLCTLKAHSFFNKRCSIAWKRKMESDAPGGISANNKKSLTMAATFAVVI